MPSFRIININTSAAPQQWTSFLDDVEQTDYELGVGESRGNGADDVWEIEENFKISYSVIQNGMEMATELRYAFDTNTWTLNPQINPFALNIAAPINEITNVTLECG